MGAFRGRLGRLALVGVVMVLVAGIVFGRDLSVYWDAFWLERGLAPFLADPVETEKSLSNPVIRGKLLPIDIQQRALSSIYHDLPADLRAREPLDVGTIARLDWETREGEEGHSPVRRCQITLVRRDTNVVVGKAVISTTAPQSSKISTRGVVEWLSGLPRR